MDLDERERPSIVVQPRRGPVGRLFVRDEHAANLVIERIVQRDESMLDRVRLERVLVVVQVLDRRSVAVRRLEVDGELTARLILLVDLARAQHDTVVLLAKVLAQRWLRVQVERAVVVFRRRPVAHLVAALRRAANTLARLEVALFAARIRVERALL